jgi:hypothetical protein
MAAARRSTARVGHGHLVVVAAAEHAPLGSTAVDTTPIANIEVTQQAFQSGPGQVQVKGFAAEAAGKPLPIDQIEQRMVANKQAFDLNGRRTLRAGGAGSDGTLSYDPVGPNNPKGINWTATYGSTVPGVPPLDGHDVAMAVGAESRGIWLGTNRRPSARSRASFWSPPSPRSAATSRQCPAARSAPPRSQATR